MTSTRSGSPWTAKLCGPPGAYRYAPRATTAAVTDGAGGAIVVWQDGRLGDDGVDLYAQRVSAAGTMLWSSDGVPVFTHPAGSTDPPAAFSQVVTADGSGGAIVAWRDTRTDVTLGNTEIYAQRISSSGAALWTTNGVKVLGFALPSTWPVRNPVIASDGFNGAIIAWQDGRNAVASANDLYVQRVNSAGVVLWTANGVLACGAPGDQGYLDIAALPGGETVLVWEDKRSGNYDIYAQRFSASGTGQWGANGRIIASVTNDQRTPRVTIDSQGGIVIAWQDGRTSPSAPDIYAQKVDTAGMLQWSANGVPVCVAVGWQGRIRSCSGTAGDTIFTWTDNRADPSGTTIYYDIYAQILDSGGCPAWATDGIPVAVAERTQRLQQTVSEQSGGAYVVWEDDRNLGWDIYAQRIVPEAAPLVVADIPDAKAHSDGTRVRLPARVVTGAFSGFFYIEEPDRRAAIKVVSSQPVSVGNLCVVEGVLGTSCEREITATSITPAGTGTVPGTLGMPLARINGLGSPSTAGLLIRTCGEVVSVSGSPVSSFLIRDGSVDVLVRGSAPVNVGQYVSVTAVRSCEASAAVLLIRGAGDVRVMK